MNQNCLLRLNTIYKYNLTCAFRLASISRCGFSTQSEPNFDIFEKKKENFPVLNILPHGKVKKEQRIILKNQTISPRYKRMAINQDWGNVWPAARSFHPASVPLPIHMSYTNPIKLQSPTGKFNNPELLKIPNFLHLTPPVVKRQCEALKKFCTKWPETLKTDENCDAHFPVKVVTKDFIFSGPSLRWLDARIVEIRLKLELLQLDEHASDKIKRLLRHRYNAETDEIIIRTDSCPVRKQNYDYGLYLLTALYFESWKTENWESEKEYVDWERYFWDRSKSCQSINEYLRKVNPAKYCNNEEILKDDVVKNYAKAVTQLYDQKESDLTLQDYKKSVMQLLF